MKSDLPLDLVDEILSRVPATSLKRLRSTCKRWNALFKDQRFRQKHFRKAPKESLVLMLKDNTVCSMSVNINVTPPCIEFKSTGLGLKDSHSNLQEVVDNIDAIFHCEGLLLCITKDNKPAVWNPCSGETRWIQPRNSYEWYYSFALGFEEKKSCRSYKILMWCPSHQGIPQDRVNAFEIYEFISDSWRVLDHNAALDCSILLPNICVSLKGNIYWLAYDKKDDFILCFDFTIERFKRLCLLPFVVVGHQMTLSVVGEKQLAVWNESDSISKMEIWVTNKIDIDEAVLKWSKSFTVDVSICGDDRLFWSTLIDEEKKVVLCSGRSGEIGKAKIYMFGEDDEYYTEVLYAISSKELTWYPPCFISYVPSLVQI